jgi:cell division protein FtsA
MDIGGGTTDIAVIDDGGVEGTKMFGIGGRSFTHQIAEALGVDFDTAENYKLDYDTGKLDDRIKSKIETAISHNLSVWLSGVEVALEEFNSTSSLPRNVLLCGGGASLSLLQESLAISDWYKDLPFSRRPIIHLMDTAELPNLITDEIDTLDHSYATALGLLRVGMDTLAGAPEENSLRAKISKLLQH